MSKSTGIAADRQRLDRAGLSDEQRVAVAELVHGTFTGRTQQQTLGGYAGTGKTTSIKAIKEELPSFAVCAFTGKAANMLRRKGITDATTIHSAIYVPIRGADGRVYFDLRKHMPDGIDGFIVDEASMVSKPIHRDLMSFGLPIIFVGDHGQLEPVGSDFNLMAKPDYTLEKIHRNSGEIPRFAEWLRLGRPAREFKSTSGAVTLINNDEVDDDIALNADQIICAFNKSRVSFDKHVRLAMGRKGLVEVGERVMCLRNDRTAAIFNGMQGTVSKVATVEGKLCIDFATYDGTRFALPVDRDQFGQEKSPGMDSPRSVHPFDYCYVITAHKSQGDEWPTVLVFEQRCSKWDHKRWAYTAASRAQERLLWVTEKRGGR
jgi:exodeoxyribonuclease V